MANSDSDRVAPGGRGRRKVFLVMTAVLVVVVLAVVGFVVLRPAKTASATQDAEKNPAATTAPAVPSPSASPDSGPAVNPSTTAAANTSPGTSSSTIAATGGGAGSAVADLADTTPLQNNDMGNLSTGPEQIGTTTYQNSVGFTCDSGDDYVTATDLIYNVAGYKFLTAVFGIPSDATNNTMTITFFKDGSTTQLATPMTISLDHPQSVHLNLDGSSQLEIACNATSVANHSKVDMDGAMGNATIGPN
jgi:cytoskeletal protein RodZ